MKYENPNLTTFGFFVTTWGYSAKFCISIVFDITKFTLLLTRELCNFFKQCAFLTIKIFQNDQCIRNQLSTMKNDSLFYDCDGDLE